MAWALREIAVLVDGPEQIGESAKMEQGEMDIILLNLLPLGLRVTTVKSRVCSSWIVSS